MIFSKKLSSLITHHIIFLSQHLLSFCNDHGGFMVSLAKVVPYRHWPVFSYFSNFHYLVYRSISVYFFLTENLFLSVRRNKLWGIGCVYFALTTLNNKQYNSLGKKKVSLINVALSLVDSWFSLVLHLSHYISPCFY